MTGPAETQAARPHFFGRRKGKALRPGRARLMADFLPLVAVPPPGDPALAEPAGLFGRPVSRLWLEIGFGGGEHLAGQAAANPDVGIIGCEAFVNGVARLLAHIAGTPAADTVRVHSGDARLLLPCLPDACLDRVFLLFPDPWPKPRHAKRRFTCPENLAVLARLMKDGAELRVASDDMTYIRFTLEMATRHPDFAWTAEGPDDWLTRPADWIPTRYEEKALRAGRVPIVLSFVRRPRAGACGGGPAVAPPSRKT